MDFWDWVAVFLVAYFVGNAIQSHVDRVLDVEERLNEKFGDE